MQIIKMFEAKQIVFSFEIFPPKITSPIETIYKTLAALQDLKPDYISVTYGAGGNISDNRTSELSSLVKNKYGIESLAHLTCINSSKVAVDIILQNLKEQGVENILALRGDIPKQIEAIGEFNYAYELIEYIKQKNGFGIAAACYPEGHMDADSLQQDIEALKIKVDAGTDYLITQLFFDNNYFYDFMDLALQKGIDIPIQAGIMPAANKRQIERIVSLCGAAVPNKFIKIMNKYEHDQQALQDAGIAYAVEQIIDLISSGVRGIHLYTMNNPYIARKITENISTVLKFANNRKDID
ncbi:MAG: methylenetetrahydrofolate reductase [NAD(P)H] [Firmicutes bacterium]|nr:methylenetetrahydrofolate reductase [NAD(P)H] [Bacillota bacterium]